MDTLTKSQTLPSRGFSIEELFKAAFVRTKERFVPYILASILSFAIFFGVFLGIAILFGIVIAVGAISKSTALGVGLGSLLSIISVVVLIYIGSWISLAVSLTIISPDKKSFTEYFKEAKPLVWKYYWVSLLTSLFLLGLLPFGIISLFILYLVWGLWGAFTVFVFIEKKETGLRNLWWSKAIVSAHFWGVLLRVVMVYLAYYFIIYLAALAGGPGKDGSTLIGALTFILGMFAQPFIVSYLYEIYRNLEHPKEVGTNRGWVILSVIGYILVVVGIVSAAGSIAKNAPSMMEKIEESLDQAENKNGKTFQRQNKGFDFDDVKSGEL